MYWYEFLINNKELIKILYGLVIGIICLIIVLKTHKLYHFSGHEGIRYFRNAFLFYGLAFVIRYIFGGIVEIGYIEVNYISLIRILFEFFLVMGGFFLLYSLLWKKLETAKDNLSSLISLRSFVFYGMAFIIAVIDFIWQVHYFLFLSQMILFLVLSIMSYTNYRRDKGKNVFPKFYFVAMVFSLIAWILNGIAGFYFNWSRAVLIEVYVLNIIVFLLFLYGVIKITKKPKL
ncbi:hypothetical protein GOV12_02165 [Candidatus Pacearchaeota archaeon]|nr:hypothetical protein [Candidatus Pacearchaeota archaeon]